MIIKKPGMAWIGKINSLTSIPDADKIQRAEVICGKGGKWTGVVGKEVKIEDIVFVFLSDAIVPNVPQFSFMEKQGFRVKMMRLRGCPSEVLIIKASEIISNGEYLTVGNDVTDLLGVLKYEKDIPASIAGDIEGDFPNFIPKTDELNFQRVSHFRQALLNKPYYATVKYDGTSQTFFHYQGNIGACSRNLMLKEKDGTAVWEIAKLYDLKTEVPKLGDIALQWECVGPGIQGNPLKLKTIEPRLFNIFFIKEQEYANLEELKRVSATLALPMVQIVEEGIYNDWNDDQLREKAKGKYQESGTHREGTVIRPKQSMRVDGERLSFKVINLDYKER